MSHHVASDPQPEVTVNSSKLAKPVSPARNRVAVVAVAIAIVALALAAWSLLRPHPTGVSATPSRATEEQITNAKARACAASTLVDTAVSSQTHADPGADPAAAQAVAANARLSMVAGSSYLLARLDAATPSPLADRIRSFADDLQDVVVHTMAGVSNDEPDQTARLQNAQATSAQIADLCK